MKILFSPPETEPATARPSNVQALHWRKALEQAQWQARQRIAPSQGGAAGPAPDGPAPTERPIAHGVEVDGRMPPVQRLPALANEARPVEALAQSTMALLSRALVAADATAGAPAAPGALAASDPPRTTPATSESSAAQPLVAWTELPEWPAVVVHANVQGNRLSVALRDGTLSESDALELYYRLRGQLRGAGYELAEMTINGQPVIPAA